MRAMPGYISFLHGAVGLGRDDSGDTVPAREVLAPDLLYLLACLLREKFQLDNGVQ